VARNVEAEAGEDFVVRATPAGGSFVHLTIVNFLNRLE
jgi:hypothetical protein